MLLIDYIAMSHQHLCYERNSRRVGEDDVGNDNGLPLRSSELIRKLFTFN